MRRDSVHAAIPAAIPAGMPAGIPAALGGGRWGDRLPGHDRGNGTRDSRHIPETADSLPVHVAGTGITGIGIKRSSLVR